MSHSRLFRQITGALRIARHAHRRGMNVHEAAEMHGAACASGLSRRRFLQLVTAATAVPLLSTAGCSRCTSKHEVVIVGAGLAGLHCAYRLVKLGLSPQIFDAAGRVGGRVLTDRVTFAPQHCELGGELIDSTHDTMHDLAEELGIQLVDYEDDEPGLDRLVAYIDGRHLTMAEILDGFVPIAAAIDAALGTLEDQRDLFVYYDKPNGGEALDALSISAWLDRIGASGPVRTLLEVAYTTFFGLDPEVHNVLNMMFQISTDTSAFELYGDSDARYRAADGNDTYIEKLLAAVGSDRVQLEHRLEAVRQDGAGRYILTFRSGTRSVDVVAGHVVLALPFTTLREVDLRVELPPVKRTAIQELGMGMNTKLMCGFASRPWRAHGSNGVHFNDLAYQSTWETSRLQPGEQGILTNYMGGSRAVAVGDRTLEAHQETFLAELELVYPGARAAASGRMVRAYWPSHPLTRGSYSGYLVGQYTTIAGVEIERVGNLHFCGEHTSLDAQGYMEGAALTGAMAADEVAADLGVDAVAGARHLGPGSAVHRIATRARTARVLRRWKRALGPGKGAPALR